MSYDIDILIVQLRDGRWATRAEAARTLTEYPDQLARDDLVRLLEDREDKVRYWAVRALDQLESRDLARILAGRLHDPSAGVRMAAARALARRVDRAVLPELLSCLDDGHEDVVYWAVEACVRAGAAAVPSLLGCLAHPSWRRREAAAEALVRIGEATVQPLLKALDGEDTDTCFWAIRVLGRLRAVEAVPRLREFLSEERRELAAAAVRALATLGDRDSLRAIVGLLGHPDPELRGAAVEALATFGDFAVKLLADLLDGHRRMVKFAASEALGASGDGALQPVLEKLRADSDELRYWAVRALERFESPVVVPLLVDLLTDESQDVQLAAAEALGAKRLPPDLAPSVLRHLAAEDWRVRQAVARAVGAQDGWPAETFAPWVRDQDEDVRFWSVRVLASRRDPATIPMLLERFEDEAWPIRNAAAEALAAMGPAGMGAIREAMVQRAGDSNQRYWLTRSLVGIRELALVPGLVNLLADPDRGVRGNAFDALVAMGDAAVPDLLHALRTVEVRSLREAISKVLVQMRPTRLGEILTLLDYHEPELNYWGSWILGNLGAPAVPLLADRVRSGSERERVMCMRSLAYVADPRTIRLCLESLADEFVSIRRVAIETLGKFRVGEAGPRLREFLEVDEQDLRMAALTALGRIGGEGVVEALVPHLESRRWEVVRVAIEALGELGDTAAGPALKGLLVPEHRDHWRFVLAALERVGRAEDVPDLVALLPQAEGELLPRVIRCLGTLGGPAEAVHLVPMLGHPSWDVREAAVEAYAALGEGADAEPLKALARAEDPLLRSRARRALKQVLGERRWTALQTGQLRRTLEDPAEEAYREAGVCIAEKRVEEAEKLLRKALRHAKRAEYHGLLGGLCMESGERAKALRHFRKACALAPEDPVVLVKLGVLQSMEGQDRKAAATLRQVLEMDPPTPVAELARRTLAGIKSS